jgi:DNA-binding Lrp family transcriptional regulator
VNHTKTGRAQATRGASPSGSDLESDLALLARLEGKPIPTVEELADLLKVSKSTAFRSMNRLKRSGMLKLVDRVLTRPGLCECIANLRTSLTDKGAVNRLEARLRLDPFVSTAAAVTGQYSYRVGSLHADAATANAWFRALLTEPAVTNGALILCRSIIDRPSYAQALLGSRDDAASLGAATPEVG